MSTIEDPAEPVNRVSLPVAVMHLRNFLAFAELQGFWLVARNTIVSLTSRSVARSLELDRVDERTARVLGCAFVTRGQELTAEERQSVSMDWTGRAHWRFLRWLQDRGYQLARIGSGPHGPHLRVLDVTWPADRDEILNHAAAFLAEPR